jgi:hypothetical protein
VRIFRIILVLGAILHLSGGQWGILQGVAWTKMLVEYSQADGLRQGIIKTFDGEHPCELCKSISKSRESEKKQDPRAPIRLDGLSLKDLLPQSSADFLRRDVPLSSLPANWALASLIPQWHSIPDAPPPRALHGYSV